MMKKLWSQAAMCSLLLVLSACTQMTTRPDSPQEAFLLAENNYTQVQLQVLGMQRQGLLSADDEERISKRYDDYEGARDKALELAETYEFVADVRAYNGQVDLMERAVISLHGILY